MSNPIDGFTVSAEEFTHAGKDLQRPECVLAESDGTLWVADARGGVVKINPDGTQSLIRQLDSMDEDDALSSENMESRLLQGTLPNGLAFDAEGNILIANFGTDRLERMTRDGHTDVVFEEIGGERIGKINFPCRDSKGRVWMTVSTQIVDWSKAISPNIKDGRLLVWDEDNGVRIVAEGLGFANECKLDAGEEYLYVAQTTSRNIVRYKINADSTLGEQEIYGPEDHGRMIDGIAFDAHGNLWGTYIFTDGIFAITPDREVQVIFEDSTPEEIEELDAAFQTDQIAMNGLMKYGGKEATWCASITFGGPDLKNVYVGSLKMNTLPTFRSPVPGLPLTNWNS